MNTTTLSRLLALMGLGLALLAGCAPLTPPPGAPATPETAWSAFQAGLVEAEESGTRPGFNLSASINYVSPKRASRMLASFYGNYDHPMRLDLTAGMGAPLAYLFENGSFWVAYYPGEERAYLHTDGRAGASAAGFETPLSLAELAGLLSGRYRDLMPPAFTSARTVEGGWEFSFPPGADLETLVLDWWGRPIRLTGFSTASGPAWNISLADFADPAAGGAYVTARPGRVELARSTGEEATLRIRKFEELASPWPDDKLRFTLPPGTTLIDLESPMPPEVTP